MKTGILCALAALLWAAPPLPAAFKPSAPHHGSLQTLGDEFAQVEFVLDPKAGVLTAYVLDGEAEDCVRLSQKSIELRAVLQPGDRKVHLSLKAVANILSGETVGDSSQFEARSPALIGCTALEGRLTRLEIHGAIFKNVRVKHPAGNENGGKP